MPWLLDTNVLSELRRPAPEQRVVDFVASCPLNQLYVSTVTLAEIRFGIEQAAYPARRAALNQWLEQIVRPMFVQGVVAISEDVMLRWRLLVEQGRKTGHTFSQPDLIIAATALEHNMVLVTRNVKDFAGLGLTILNPWD
jgi:predicted nucleic acid-binding protein